MEESTKNKTQPTRRLQKEAKQEQLENFVDKNN